MLNRSPQSDATSGEAEIDAVDLYVLPGAIDGHVHMRTERKTSSDDTFALGPIAAAFGGVTSIVDGAGRAGSTLEAGLIGGSPRHKVNA